MAYWALKTWEDSDNDRQYIIDKDKWDDFKRERVIAIGWKELDISLTIKTELADIKEALKRTHQRYLKTRPDRAALTIYNFIHLDKDDSILLCRGYAYNSSEKVHLYGTATNIGDFYDTNNRKEWRFKHGANVEEFLENKREIEKEELVNMLGKRSLMLTLQEIPKEGFEKVVKWARH